MHRNRSRSDTHRLLADLSRANLLTEHDPGRYAFHDLLRAYAADLGHEHNPVVIRSAAVERLLDHYVAATYAADRILNPLRDPLPPKADARRTAIACSPCSGSARATWTRR